MRASILLVLVLSAVLVGETDAKGWWRKAVNTVKKVVKVVKDVVDFIRNTRPRTKREADRLSRLNNDLLRRRGNDPLGRLDNDLLKPRDNNPLGQRDNDPIGLSDNAALPAVCRKLGVNSLSGLSKEVVTEAVKDCDFDGDGVLMGEELDVFEKTIDFIYECLEQERKK